MKDIELLLQEINENPQVIADVDWKEATNEFSQSTLERLMEGIADVEVMKDVAELIKDRHRIAVREGDECLYVHYAPDATFTDENGTHPDPMAGKPEYNMPVEYRRRGWLYDGAERCLDYIEYDIYRFLDLLIKDIEENRARQQRKENIRSKYASKSVACCNATHEFSETTDGEDTNKGVAVQRNVEEITDQQIADVIRKMIDDKILRRKSEFAWIMVAMHQRLDRNFSHEDFPNYLAGIGIPQTNGKIIGCPSSESLRRKKAEYEHNWSRDVADWKYPKDHEEHEQACRVYDTFLRLLGLK